jgi:hypothetical protein
MGKKMLSVMAVGLSAAVVLTACSSTAMVEGTDIDREALTPRNNVASVRVVNDTTRYMQLTVSGTDNFDWEGNRPDNAAPDGFQNMGIAGSSEVQKSFTVNPVAVAAPFTISFGDTGASVELSKGYTFFGDAPDTIFGGWGVRGTGGRWHSCSTETIKSAGYTITVVCSYYSSPNTTVTISK